MATIRLNHGYFVDTDERNYTLRQRYMTHKKDGIENETERTVGHFGTMKGAVMEYIKCSSAQNAEPYDGSIIEYAEIIDRAAKKAVKELYAVLDKR